MLAEKIADDLCGHDALPPAEDLDLPKTLHEVEERLGRWVIM